MLTRYPVAEKIAQVFSGTVFYEPPFGACVQFEEDGITYEIFYCVSDELYRTPMLAKLETQKLEIFAVGTQYTTDIKELQQEKETLRELIAFLRQRLSRLPEAREVLEKAGLPLPRKLKLTSSARVDCYLQKKSGVFRYEVNWGKIVFCVQFCPEKTFVALVANKESHPVVEVLQIDFAKVIDSHDSVTLQLFLPPVSDIFARIKTNPESFFELMEKPLAQFKQTFRVYFAAKDYR